LIEKVKTDSSTILFVFFFDTFDQFRYGSARLDKNFTNPPKESGLFYLSPTPANKDSFQGA